MLRSVLHRLPPNYPSSIGHRAISPAVTTFYPTITPTFSVSMFCSTSSTSLLSFENTSCVAISLRGGGTLRCSYVKAHVSPHRFSRKNFVFEFQQFWFTLQFFTAPEYLQLTANSCHQSSFKCFFQFFHGNSQYRSPRSASLPSSSSFYLFLFSCCLQV